MLHYIYIRLRMVVVAWRTRRILRKIHAKMADLKAAMDGTEREELARRAQDSDVRQRSLKKALSGMVYIRGKMIQDLQVGRGDAPDLEASIRDLDGRIGDIQTQLLLLNPNSVRTYIAPHYEA